MKKGLLGSTALIGATALLAGAAGAAEAPEYSLSGNANFQFYWFDQHETWQTGSVEFPNVFEPDDDTDDTRPQEHGWYFGVDEAELTLDVDGAADNGLKYGFKIEINVNTTDGTVADEARIELSGSWGTLQLGDEDGAEDIMNFGGEDLMGATGGFDGDQDDYLLRIAHTKTTDQYYGSGAHNMSVNGMGTDFDYVLPGGFIFGAPSFPTIAGDTSDATKISYYSPRFSGFQVGASLTPTPNNGDNFKEDGAWENHYGIGANYDNTFGNLHIQASAVYSAASSNSPWFEDVSAWSVGAIVGWGPFSIGGNYTDNGDSGSMIADDDGGGGPGQNTDPVPLGIESYYWNVAVGFETGPLYLSAGYFASNVDWGLISGDLIDGAETESDYSHIALTADYTMAPGLGVYAELNFIEDEHNMDNIDSDVGLSNDTTSVVLGVNVSF